MRYFFNLAGAVHDPDNLGHELPTISDARKQAAVEAGQVLLDRPEVAWLGEELRLEVTNADRLVLFTLIVIGVDAPAGAGKGLTQR